MSNKPADIYNTIITTAKTGHCYGSMYGIYVRLSSEYIIALVAPHSCIGCGLEGSLLCTWCVERLPPVPPSRCYRCKALTREFAPCRGCASRLRHVWPTTLYEGLAKDILQRYKFARAQAAAEILAEHMNNILPHFPADTVVSYVPTATKRARQRGYDQAELLARSLAVKRELSCKRLVTRLTQTRQVGANRAQRIAQMQHAFCLASPRQPIPKKVLLIDDILTTGATIESVAVVLRSAGVRHVDAAVFAQKV